jgi:AcrR family transcriptional regulator
MPRPARHDRELLLDRALRIAAEAGPQQVTVAAVARAAGAPSGSVYHRFAGRAELLGALWIRTLERFHAGFVAALRGADPVAARGAAARHVVAWSRANPDAARVLLYGPADFAEAEWPEPLARRSRALGAELAAALRALARRSPGASRAQLELVTIDVPYALVRRHLRRGGALPRGAEALAEACARSLAGAGDTGSDD